MPIFHADSTFVRRRFGALVALALALYLAGCSMVRLGYSQLPDLTYWWVDELHPAPASLKAYEPDARALMPSLEARR